MESKNEQELIFVEGQKVSVLSSDWFGEKYGVIVCKGIFCNTYRVGFNDGTVSEHMNFTIGKKKLNIKKLTI